MPIPLLVGGVLFRMSGYAPYPLPKTCMLKAFSVKVITVNQLV